MLMPTCLEWHVIVITRRWMAPLRRGPVKVELSASDDKRAAGRLHLPPGLREDGDLEPGGWCGQ